MQKHELKIYKFLKNLIFALLDAQITYMFLDVHGVGLKDAINRVHEKCQVK